MSDERQYMEVDPGIACCVDCGAVGPSPERVVHFRGCTPGESEMWRRYYDATADTPPLEEVLEHGPA